MSLQILNLSIDAPDFTKYGASEDLSYNDMESIIEIFLEGVLGIEDAISERNENDENDGTSLDFKKFFFSCGNNNSASFNLNLNDMLYDTYASSHFISIKSDVPYPPPKV